MNCLNCEQALRAFFASPREGNPGSVRHFLEAIAAYSGEAAVPVLKGIAGLGGAASPGAENLRERLESRYARIRFVHEELGRLDFGKARPGRDFDEFVFEQIDFSIYDSIEEDEFRLIWDTGLADFSDAFYEKNFRMNREAAKRLIHRAYTKNNGRYSCGGKEKQLSDLMVLSVMRTLHTSLEFAPLFDREGLLNECTGLVRSLEKDKGGTRFYLSFGDLYRELLQSLHNLTLKQGDGTDVLLSAAGDAWPVLYGTFHPHNKAHTIPLTPETDHGPGAPEPGK
jgi:hypothetical protein